MNREEKAPGRPTHWDEGGKPRMVDVSGKEPTLREARAAGKILMEETTLELVRSGRTPKGEIFTVAQVAGIQAAKRTGDLIPLCHPLRLTYAEVEITALPPDVLRIESKVRTRDRTGVEMEALAACAAAALTVYDMAKAVDRGMVIEEIRLVEKKKSRG